MNTNIITINSLSNLAIMDSLGLPFELVETIYGNDNTAKLFSTIRSLDRYYNHIITKKYETYIIVTMINNMICENEYSFMDIMLANSDLLLSSSTHIISQSWYRFIHSENADEYGSGYATIFKDQTIQDDIPVLMERDQAVMSTIYNYINEDEDEIDACKYILEYFESYDDIIKYLLLLILAKNNVFMAPYIYDEYHPYVTFVIKYMISNECDMSEIDGCDLFCDSENSNILCRLCSIISEIDSDLISSLKKKLHTILSSYECDNCDNKLELVEGAIELIPHVCKRYCHHNY